MRTRGSALVASSEMRRAAQLARRLAERSGLAAEGRELALTPWGAAQREEIEDQTDALMAAPYASLDEDQCGELRALALPWSEVFAEVLLR
jgi:broad specificity phosphatase PhoE